MIFINALAGRKNYGANNEQGMSGLMLGKCNNKFVLRLLLIAVTLMSLQLNVSNVVAGPLTGGSDHDLSSRQGEMGHQLSSHEGSAHLTAAMDCDECDGNCAGDCTGMDCNCGCSPCSGTALPCSDTLNTLKYTSAYFLLFGRFLPGTHLPPQKKPPRTIAS